MAGEAGPALSVPCETCGTPTDFTGTKRCNGCREVEIRLADYLRRGGAKALAFVERTIRDTTHRVSEPR